MLGKRLKICLQKRGECLGTVCTSSNRRYFKEGTLVYVPAEKPHPLSHFRQSLTTQGRCCCWTVISPVGEITGTSVVFIIAVQCVQISPKWASSICTIVSFLFSKENCWKETGFAFTTIWLCIGTQSKQFLSHLMSSLICKFPSLTCSLFHLSGSSHLFRLPDSAKHEWM